MEASLTQPSLPRWERQIGGPCDWHDKVAIGAESLPRYSAISDFLVTDGAPDPSRSGS
jgi:hypothetical protein